MDREECQRNPSRRVRQASGHAQRGYGESKLCRMANPRSAIGCSDVVIRFSNVSFGVWSVPASGAVGLVVLRLVVEENLVAAMLHLAWHHQVMAAMSAMAVGPVAQILVRLALTNTALVAQLERVCTGRLPNQIRGIYQPPCLLLGSDKSVLNNAINQTLILTISCG